GWRTTRTTNTFDAEDGLANPMGRFTKVDAENDTSTTADDTCTRYTYATNPGENLLTTVARVETVAVNCATTPNRPSQVISDTRTYYDNAALGTVTRADVTKTELIADWAAGAPVYKQSARSTFDDYGRV